MNQTLLTRLFKSIEGNKEEPLVRIAYTIIEDERKKGHTKLADRLDTILEGNLARALEPQQKPTLKLTRDRDGVFTIPADRRYKLPLATHIESDFLRHNMVLAPIVEEKILRIEKEYVARDRLAHHGLRPRQKILLYGSSGCGKSMTAERIAWDLGLPFYKVRFDTIISSYMGESASNLNKLFESLEKYPCVLLLDEFDIIGQQRDGKSNDVGEIHRIVNIVLGLLEEYKGQGILIATTNLEGSLDKALFRRFDEIIELPRPNENEIIDLLKITFSALNLNKEIMFKNYAKSMKGLSYALVVKIANDAAKKSIINSHKEISADDLNKALEENLAFNK
jgi:SpoVK/Ycf46/Vps4 family AAA+-type ATPase